MGNRYSKTIRKSNVASAVHIDFEGRATEEPPSLLGVLYTEAGIDRFYQFVFDPLLKIASRSTGLAGSNTDATQEADLIETLQWLVELAKSEDRTIVSWSKHDDEVLQTFLPAEGGYRYRNAIASSSRWAGRRGLARPDGNTLQWYLETLGYDVPKDVRSGAAKWIQTTRDRIQTYGEWGPVSPGGKTAWRNLVEHNRHDVFGMRHVVEVTKSVRAPTG